MKTSTKFLIARVYYSPAVEVCTFAVERGFAASGSTYGDIGAAGGGFTKDPGNIYEL